MERVSTVSINCGAEQGHNKIGLYSDGLQTGSDLFIHCSLFGKRVAPQHSSRRSAHKQTRQSQDAAILKRFADQLGGN